MKKKKREYNKENTITLEYVPYTDLRYYAIHSRTYEKRRKEVAGTVKKSKPSKKEPRYNAMMRMQARRIL